MYVPVRVSSGKLLVICLALWLKYFSNLFLAKTTQSVNVEHSQPESGRRNLHASEKYWGRAPESKIRLAPN